MVIKIKEVATTIAGVLASESAVAVEVGDRGSPVGEGLSSGRIIGGASAVDSGIGKGDLSGVGVGDGDGEGLCGDGDGSTLGLGVGVTVEVGVGVVSS